MTDHSALIERLVTVHTLDTPRSVTTGSLINPDGPEAAAALRDLTEWRDIADHDNSAKEVLVETDKGVVMVAWRHHPSSRTDIWLSVPGRYQVTPVRFKPQPVLPLPSAPNQAKEAGE